MHVVATAGHVDHGKSALVSALTGNDPDRLAEERRRGLSIQLGYAWTTLPGAGEVAFVDVPGHERFISTTLAGLGPVPAVLFVVAADDPWMPQAAEHLAALDALGVARGVLAVTRSDLASPEPARERALAELAATSLRGSRAVPVSARTGAGLADLRAALAELLRDGRPPAQLPVRLWVDRSFAVAGAGTVVTGTLPAGTVRPGDRLVSRNGEHRVREVQSLGRPVEVAHGVARVALNVTAAVVRGDVLVTPGAWHHTEVVDVRLGGVRLGTGDPPQRPLLHVGSTALTVHHRPLGDGLARLTAGTALPLRIGDRALLRDPGTRRLWGVTVLDPAPPPLRRRGAAAARARALADADGTAHLTAEVARRGMVAVDLLRRLGVPVGTGPGRSVVAADGWLLSPQRVAQAAEEAERVVREHTAAAPLEPALTLAALADRLGLPGREAASAVVGAPLRVAAGRVLLEGTGGVPADVLAAVHALRERLTGRPFAAPATDELAALGLDATVQSAAVRAGLVLRVAPGVLLLAGADDEAAEQLAQLSQPFTVSDGRRHLGTSRRVALPLLAHLDRTGRTRRLPDDRRHVTGR